MEKDVVIKVEGLYKKFTRSLKRSLFYGSIDVARSMLGLSYDTSTLRKGEFWSLQDINFELKRGETFGLVGANGSGKSTLLRMINGIFPPDAGKIEIRGRIGALIAVGAGFHPHMTGRENILLNATVLGMTRDEVMKEMDSIIEFADIGDFLDAPVSTYSSGMTVRLGFSIAIHSHPDIVLVDEILAVGDAKFQRKCLDKIKEMREAGTTFVLVSHNMQNIEAMCDQVLLMDHGKQVMLGTPREIIPVYELLLQTGKVVTSETDNGDKANVDNTKLNLVFRYPDFGTDEVSVESVRLVNAEGKAVVDLKSEEPMSLEVVIDSKVNIKNGIVYMTLNYVVDRQRMDDNIVALGSQLRFDCDKGRSRLIFSFSALNLTTGEYSLGLTLFDEAHTNPYSQGYYGYFTVRKGITTMLRVGAGTPLLWAEPDLKVINE